MDIGNNLINTANIVCDVDEVLVNISPKWYQKAFELGFAEKHMTEDEILHRPEYYLDSMIKKKHLESFYDLYFNSSNFYQDLELTSFGRSIINLAIVKPRAINKIHIISKCGSDVNLPVNRSKRRWLDEVFKEIPHPKLEIHFITEDKKKDYIFNHCDDINIFADDKPQNIADILLNKPEKAKINNIAIPKLGYNTLPDICHAYAKLNSTSILYYNSVK